MMLLYAECKKGKTRKERKKEQNKVVPLETLFQPHLFFS